MKAHLLAVVAVVALVVAGCSNGAPAQSAENAIDACRALITEQYEQTQRPPSITIDQSEQLGDAYIVTGTSEGKSSQSATMEFECRHHDGTVELSEFESIPKTRGDSVKISGRIELSDSIPPTMRASSQSIEECLDLLAGEYSHETVGVSVEEGVDSGSQINIGGEARSARLGVMEFWCQSVGADTALELAYHGPAT